jgi:hypothetical protein
MILDFDLFSAVPVDAIYSQAESFGFLPLPKDRRNPLTNCFLIQVTKVRDTI